MQTIIRTFGTTSCEITGRAHITGGARDTPYIATATVERKPVLNDRGEPLELHAGSEDDAIRRMIRELERRFGPLE
jgi:hypothetical protein